MFQKDPIATGPRYVTRTLRSKPYEYGALRAAMGGFLEPRGPSRKRLVIQGPETGPAKDFDFLTQSRR